MFIRQRKIAGRDHKGEGEGRMVGGESGFWGGEVSAGVPYRKDQ